MAQPAENGNCFDATVHLPRARDGLLLGERLVRARLVVEAETLDAASSPRMMVARRWGPRESSRTCSRDGVNSNAPSVLEANVPARADAFPLQRAGGRSRNRGVARRVVVGRGRLAARMPANVVL
jgi:hypothetical protein